MPEVGRFLFLHSESSCSFYRNENGVVISYGKLGQIDIATLHRVGFERVTTNRDEGKETEKDTTTTPSTPFRRCPQDQSLHSHSHNRTGNRSSAASPAGTSSSCVLPCDTVHTSSLSALESLMPDGLQSDLQLERILTGRSLQREFVSTHM